MWVKRNKTGMSSRLTKPMLSFPGRQGDGEMAIKTRRGGLNK